MDRKALLLAAWRLNRSFPLLIGGLLLANIVAYAVITSVVSPRIDELERRYIDRQADMRYGRRSGEGTRTPAAIFRQGEADLGTFRSAIPAKTDYTALIGEIFSLAAAAGLDIGSVSYAPKEIPEEGLLRYALSFSVQGNYEQIKRFIFSLEQSGRLVAIENLSLGGGRTGETGVELRLQLATFFRTDVS